VGFLGRERRALLEKRTRNGWGRETLGRGEAHKTVHHLSRRRSCKEGRGNASSKSELGHKNILDEILVGISFRIGTQDRIGKSQRGGGNWAKF